MAENEQNVLARLAHLLGLPPRAVAVAVATAEAREEAPLPLEPDALLARHQALVARRHEVMDARAEAARALAERLQPIHERASELREQVIEVRRRLAETINESLEAEVSAATESDARERELRKIDAELRECADARLVAFVRESQSEAERLRAEGLHMYKGLPNPLTDISKSFSNYPSLIARLDALRSAIAVAESMQLEDLTTEEVEERLVALHAALPEVQVVQVAAA